MDLYRFQITQGAANVLQEDLKCPRKAILENETSCRLETCSTSPNVWYLWSSQTSGDTVNATSVSEGDSETNISHTRKGSASIEGLTRFCYQPSII